MDILKVDVYESDALSVKQDRLIAALREMSGVIVAYSAAPIRRTSPGPPSVRW